MPEYYDLVPKDRVENLEWRIKCRKQALADPRFRNAFWQACMDDVCYFMAAACIAKGTRVVTARGPVPIENVQVTDRVWDGAEWVTHEGVLNKGRRPTIFAYKINVTPDHKIWTQYGWKIASERHDRQGVRLPDGYSKKWKLSEYDEGSLALPMQVRETDDGGWRQFEARKEHELWLQGAGRSKNYPWQDGNVYISPMGWHDPEVYQSEQQVMGELRRSWYFCLREMAQVREFLCRHGGSTEGPYARSHRQRRELRAVELPLGDGRATNEQPASEENAEIRYIQGAYDDLRDHGDHRADSPVNFLSNQAGLASGTVIDAEDQSSSSEVYDLLNCGSRKAFTVLDDDDRPLLVHNCWGYDPRSKHKIVPFVPWPHQEEVFRKLDWAIDYCAEEERTLDVLVDKSRAQGGTFGYLWVDLRRWLRDSMFSAGYVTRNADLVDSKTDSDTVLWKMQFALDMLPEWMVPKYARNLTQHTFENKENGALLKGYAAAKTLLLVAVRQCLRWMKLGPRTLWLLAKITP